MCINAKGLQTYLQLLVLIYNLLSPTQNSTSTSINPTSKCRQVLYFISLHGDFIVMKWIWRGYSINIPSGLVCLLSCNHYKSLISMSDRMTMMGESRRNYTYCTGFNHFRLEILSCCCIFFY